MRKRYLIIAAGFAAVLVLSFTSFKLINNWGGVNFFMGRGYNIKVDDFGAKADDGTDDGEAIRSAVAAAIEKGGGANVIFSKGRYTIGTTSADSPLYAFFYKDIEGLSFIGNETEIYLTDNFINAFRFNNCRNISIKGFTIDYETPPWAQGEVIDINAADSTFDMRVENGYTLFDDPRWKDNIGTDSSSYRFGMVMDKENPILLKKTVPDFFKGMETISKTGESTYRIGLDSRYGKWIGSNITIGDKVVINNRVNDADTFHLSFCTDISISDCTVYASAGGIIVGGYMEGCLDVDNLKVLRRPGSSRWLVTNADGVYIQNMRGRVKLTDSVFEGLSDDCMNLHTTALVLNEVHSPDRIEVTGRQVPEAGEMLEVFDTVKGVIRGRTEVTGCEIVKHYSDVLDRAILTLASPIPDMVPGKDNKSGDTVYNVNVRFQESLIENNIFRESRRFGIKLNTEDTTVRNNTFELLGGPAFYIYNLPTIPEGLGVNNLDIIGNTIEAAPYLDSWDKAPHGAPVIIRAQNIQEKPAEGLIHTNIRIIGNNISHTSRNAMYIASTDNIHLENNIVRSYAEDEVFGTITGLVLDNVNNAEIRGLQLTDPRPELSAGIAVKSNCSNIELGDNKFDMATGVTEVSR